jgi:membrane protease YdiL (CAAX protease family)
VKEARFDSHGRSPLLFVALVLALSVPLWLLGEKYRIQILPGLPLSAIMVVCPLAAALILVAYKNGRAAVLGHLAKSFDSRRIAPAYWYLPIVLLQPAVAVVSYCVMRMLHIPVPAPQFSLTAALSLFALFFVGALCEESGWSGYLIDPLQQRWGPLRASLMLGAFWAAWHWLPLLQVGRTWDWIGWWTLGTVATRVLHTWLYNSTGKSVFGATVFHAMTNVSWQLFPNNGSHYDPRISGLILTLIALILASIGQLSTRASARYLTNSRST